MASASGLDDGSEGVTPLRITGPSAMGGRCGLCMARTLMCRNIKTLHNFKPPATDEEIRASAVQFVRKLSGFAPPSKANEPAFDHAVEQVTAAARELLRLLVSNSQTRVREAEVAMAWVRA